MSLKFINLNISRLGKHPVLSDVFLKVKNEFILDVCRATITSKAVREDKHKPAPFPYKEKKYTFLRSLFDKTTSRFDENSKIIVVEGSVAVGKTRFAKELAKELDFYHIEEANMDMKYINKYGNDLRKLDDKLPLSMQSYDEKKFCKEPKHLNTAAFQIWMFRLRYSLYVDALAHIFNTGQGVVIERSPWCDFAFTEAMYKNGYISKNARNGYMAVRKNTITSLLRPHLVIYLDTPVDKIKENIKARGYPHEQNSPALTDQYLQDLEDMFKTEFLPTLTPYSELLMYDWTEEGDVEAVIEDIERIDFEGRLENISFSVRTLFIPRSYKINAENELLFNRNGSRPSVVIVRTDDYKIYTKYDDKFVDWFIGKEDEWATARYRYTEQKRELMHLFNVPYVDAPELIAPGEDIEEYNQVVHNHPEFKFEDGFDPDRESGLLLKLNDSRYIKY